MSETFALVAARHKPHGAVEMVGASLTGEAEPLMEACETCAFETFAVVRRAYGAVPSRERFVKDMVRWNRESGTGKTVASAFVGEWYYWIERVDLL